MNGIATKKVSIIVPVHNAEKTLNMCVESIINQDYGNIECILVENNSTDSSGASCLKYADEYDNVIAISIVERGVSNARNRGLNMASGDIVGFCDADDFLEPGAIKAIVKEFQDDAEVDAVFCGFNIGIKNSDSIIKKEYRGLKERKVSAPKALQLTIIDDSVMGSVWNKYYEASVLRNTYFDSMLSFCEDMHFNAKVLSKMNPSRKVKIISKPIYCYMENLDSVTHDVARLFDENNELKYIIALNAIARDCILDKTTLSMIKMKVACFCIDTLTCMNIDEAKKEKLESLLRKNYWYLLTNIFRNNWKWNFKRTFYGGKILLSRGN